MLSKRVKKLISCIHVLESIVTYHRHRFYVHAPIVKLARNYALKYYIVDVQNI